ncbi:hypothetical protein LT85_4923 [Collimonas arenae]|uniref:N-acetyltransferase domain-containing protein n=1 Tax=Collimonas arenae TaxID=279058 RepID=A0A0A1FHM0_9BURK|nr:hypothetical protein LT85_4923 [Collimonas arenae]
MFIEREYRRNGYGKYLFETSLRTLSYSHKKHLLFFSRPAMEKMARDAGFQVYESEHDFVQKQPLRWLFIKFFYKVQWLSNFYRIRELLRKKREFGSKFHFKIAVLHPE